MPADYILEIETARTPAEMAEALLEQCGGESAQQNEQIDVFSAEYYVVVAQIGERAHAASLGIAPAIRLTFFHRPYGYEFTISAVKRFTLYWLRTTHDNLALLFESDIVYLYRKAGQIYVDNATDFWEKPDLEGIAQPYVLMDIPPLST